MSKEISAKKKSKPLTKKERKEKKKKKKKKNIRIIKTERKMKDR